MHYVDVLASHILENLDINLQGENGGDGDDDGDGDGDGDNDVMKVIAMAMTMVMVTGKVMGMAMGMGMGMEMAAVTNLSISKSSNPCCTHRNPQNLHNFMCQIRVSRTSENSQFLKVHITIMRLLLLLIAVGLQAIIDSPITIAISITITISIPIPMTRGATARGVVNDGIDLCLGNRLFTDTMGNVVIIVITIGV